MLVHRVHPEKPANLAKRVLMVKLVVKVAVNIVHHHVQHQDTKIPFMIIILILYLYVLTYPYNILLYIKKKEACHKLLSHFGYIKNLAFNSGILTVILNRLGDSRLLIIISFIIIFGR